MRFRDIYMPSRVPGFPCISVPSFSTTLTEAESGDERAQQNWSQALHTFRLPKAIREHAVYEALKTHWYAMRGPASLFPFRDPLDFASVDLNCPNVAPTLTRFDQEIGTGDGSETQFQLVKRYEVGSEIYTRRIQLPVESTVIVGIDGTTPDLATGGPYTVSVQREGGLVTISPAPDPGHIITAGFLFDVAVRYEQDNTLEGILESMHVSGNADLRLIERRLC